MKMKMQSMPSQASGRQEKRVEDLEVKDAQLIFQAVWHELEEEVGVGKPSLSCRNFLAQRFSRGR